MRFECKKTVVLSCICVMLLMGQKAFAENILSSIQINPSGNSYQIVINSNSAVPVKKVVENSDKVYFELQNIEPLKSVSTIYNNVSNIDNVIVQPLSKNSVRIIVQGKNVDKSKLSFKTLNSLKQEISQQTKTSVELDKPLSSYAPIFKDEEEIKETELFTTTGTINTISSQLKSIFGSKMWLQMFGFLLILFCGVRVLKKGKKADNDIKIGLSQSVRTTSASKQNFETNLAEKMEQKQAIRSPKTSLNNTAKMNYGLNNYKKAQKSPYASAISQATTITQPKTFDVPNIPTIPTSSNELKSNTQALFEGQSKLITAKLNAQAATATLNTTTSEGVDSIKFIESMSRIYEKNGRSDLAAGLRENLKKAQSRQNF